jgi:ribosomal protein L32
MPVPKRKRSRARIRKAFANKGLDVKSFQFCPTCKQKNELVSIVSHTACKSCGFYKGAKVLRTKNERALTRTAERQKKAPAKSAQAPQE